MRSALLDRRGDLPSTFSASEVSSWSIISAPNGPDDDVDEASPDKQSSSNRRRAPAKAAADSNQDDQRSCSNMDVLDDA